MSFQHDYPDFATYLADAMQHLGGLADESAARIENAAALASNQLVAGHKLVLLGTPGIAPLGELFCHGMLYSNADQRPALPAIAIQANASALSANDSLRREEDAHSDGADMRQFLRAAEAVASAGDTLIVLSDQRLPALAQALENFYINRGVCSVLIAPDALATTTSSPAHNIVISLECDTIASIQQVTLFILNSLADMIETRVFGDLNN
ncbi:MAG: hypothetical protein WBN40_10150 [Pseudomonadales bacterium]